VKNMRECDCLGVHGITCMSRAEQDAMEVAVFNTPRLAE
jgi:hypothetical protein